MASDPSLMSYPAITPAQATEFTRALDAKQPMPTLQYRASSDRHSIEYIRHHGRPVKLVGVLTQQGKVWLDTRTKDGEILKAGLGAFILQTDETLREALQARKDIDMLVMQAAEAQLPQLSLKHRILAYLTQFWPTPAPAAQAEPAGELAF